MSIYSSSVALKICLNICTYACWTLQAHLYLILKLQFYVLSLNLSNCYLIDSFYDGAHFHDLAEGSATLPDSSVYIYNHNMCV